MKKGIKLGILITILFTSTKVYAFCNDSKLNDYAEKVKVVYKEEVKTNDYNPEYAYVLLLSPYNEQVNVKVKSGGKTYDISYDEHYKTNAIGSNIHFNEKKYEIELYGNDKSSCNGELLRKIEYIIPGYNKYADYEYCETHKNEDICKSNIDSSNMTDEKFTKKTNSEVTYDNSFLGIIKRYWYFIVIPVLIVGGVYYYKVYLLKKKESKK